MEMLQTKPKFVRADIMDILKERNIDFSEKKLLQILRVSL